MQKQKGIINGIALLIVLVVGAAIGLMYWQKKSGINLFCTQVVVKARNPLNGELKEFKTPCDVPEGWQEVERKNTDKATDLEVYTNAKYNFELRFSKDFEAVSTIEKEGCEGDYDLIIFRHKSSAQNLMSLSNGVGCVGGVPGRQISYDYLPGTQVKKFIGYSLQVENERLISYQFKAGDKDFIAYPGEYPGAEEIVDTIFSNLKLR